jgi:hypothetical protein
MLTINLRVNSFRKFKVCFATRITEFVPSWQKTISIVFC